VRRGDVTLGLRYHVDPHPELVCKVIHDEPRIVVCSARHRLAHARHVEPAMLAGEAWVGFPARPEGPDEPYGSLLRQGLVACGLGTAEIIAIDSLTAQKRMVEAGFGLGLLPESSVDEEVRLGTLRVLTVPAMRVTTPVVLVHRRRGYLSGAARQLIEILSAKPTPAGSPRRGHGR